ncbi:hypothetical protein [Shewanella sp. FJAT-51860]|nr:hypothetical protein K0H61_08840 [Shewanella acanthi]
MAITTTLSRTKVTSGMTLMTVGALWIIAGETLRQLALH